jgi:ribosomal protein S12 methylthiotransferase
MTGRVRTRELPVFPLSPDTTPLDGVSGVSLAEGGREGTRIALVTLGCDKNTVDSERIMAALVGGGARITQNVEGADVVIVNTCGFIEVAREESVDAILEACQLKDEGRVGAVVAVGCMVQRHKDELAREIPEVDLFLGLTELGGLLPELRSRGLLRAPALASAAAFASAAGLPRTAGHASAVGLPNMERPLRILSTETPHTSYLKISEGCDHTCAFCAIPHMRGLHRSAPIDELVREARQLEARGVRELNIVSQDSTWYGRDMRRQAVRDAGPGGSPETTPLLPDLLRALVDGTSIPWLRLFYMYPSGITPEIVSLIASEPRILPYLDMPIQHGSDSVLKRMRRPERRETIRERVGRLRDEVPGLVLRTTVIVGFPGETEDEFAEMLDLLSEIEFDRVGAFPYSLEEGTVAATMEGHVPEADKRDRLDALLELQRDISFRKNEAAVGSIERMIVDHAVGDDPEHPVEGRIRSQAIEVDGITRATASVPIVPGSFVEVEIVDALDYDLIARVIE